MRTMAPEMIMDTFGAEPGRLSEVATETDVTECALPGAW